MVFISTVLFVLSLSMFGLYEIQAPTTLLNKIGGTKVEGPVGAFLMGLVFGIVAAPCVDPFSIGLLSFVAAKGSLLLGFALFFTLSLGLGLPYLALGYFSGAIPNLPKSGLWMVWVKQLFGFVLLGMPLYFLRGFLPEGSIRWVTGLYIMIAGIFLGFVLGRKVTNKWFVLIRNSFGSLILASGLLVMVLWPQPIQLPYVNYSPDVLARAAREKQPVLLDFSADWCIPCQELEAKTLSESRVTSLYKYWLLVKADLTQFGDPGVVALRQSWGVSGVPTLILIGTDGREAPGKRLVGMVDADTLYYRMMDVK
jgi:thiol:disulfide interchange protein DsbD